jgi:predicted DNA binding CopG/RHH family protein
LTLQQSFPHVFVPTEVQDLETTLEITPSLTRERRRQMREEAMKKATTKTVTMTMEQVRKRKPSKAEMEGLKRLAAMRDDQIDTSDIPEMSDFSGAVRGRFYRPVTQSITIRLNAPDIAAARQLSKIKGMPYQTYIKGLLHEALIREAKTVPARARKH